MPGRLVEESAQMTRFSPRYRSSRILQTGLCKWLISPQVFCAFLNISVAGELGLATGILIASDGVALLLLYFKYPGMYPVDSH